MFNDAFLECSESCVGEGRLEINPSINNEIKPAWSMLERKTIKLAFDVNPSKSSKIISVCFFCWNEEYFWYFVSFFQKKQRNVLNA
jgi:hypothetical protein